MKLKIINKIESEILRTYIRTLVHLFQLSHSNGIDTDSVQGFHT